MPHSYEGIRAAALDTLSGREPVHYEASQYDNLRVGLGEVFARREGKVQPGQYGAPYTPDAADNETFLEVFWDLFRQGIITLGLNDSNRKFPFFRVSRLGKSIADNNAVYFFIIFHHTRML